MSAAGDRPPEPSEAAPVLELRITQGVHAGARITLEAPVDPAAILSVSVGPGLDHDVVLSDAPGSAQLRHEGGTWHWVERDFKAELASGGGWRWGGLQLALSPSGAAWEAPSRILFDRSNPQPGGPDAAARSAAPEPAGASGSVTEAATEEASTEPASPPSESARQEATGSPPLSTADSAPSSTEAAIRAGRRRWLALSAGLALVAVLVGVILSAGGGSTTTPPAVATPTPPAPAAPSARVDLKALQQALEQAGLANRVRVASLADGRVRLTGVVLDDDEVDRMIGAVRRVTPRIVQGVLTQPEFVRRVAELQNEIPQPVRMRAIPVGRLLLIDAEREGIDLPALRDWLARTLPEALEVRAIERTRLAEVEAPPVAAAAPAAVEAVAPPPPSTAIFELPELPADEPPFPAVPDIRLVIGGANPYVVLATGEKWLPGGRVGGWFLAGVEARAIILEDVRGRRVSNPR